MLTRAWRLRRLRRLLDHTSLVVTDSDTIVDNLQKIWRCIQPKDLIPIDAAHRARLYMTVSYPNLPALVAGLREQNQLIEREADGLLERKLGQSTRATSEVVLDFYLADDNQLPIDEILMLTRLRGLFQAHQCLVNRHTSHFYQRHSEMIYTDMITLTHALLDSIQ